eukprot:SAG11_NODE_1291_length_5290_cov_37.368137_2_plen_405_part_00
MDYEEELKLAIEMSYEDSDCGSDDENPPSLTTESVERQRSSSPDASARRRAALAGAKENWARKQGQVAQIQQGQQALITGLQNQPHRELAFDEDLEGRRVVVFKGNIGCSWTLGPLLSGRLIKVLVEDCEDCTLRIGCNLLTQSLEVSHCGRVTILLDHAVATVQVDLCADATVVLAPAAVAATKVYSATNGRLAVDVPSSTQHEELQQAAQGARQYVTQLLDGVLTTEAVVRDAARGNHPTTAREAAAAAAATPPPVSVGPVADESSAAAIHKAEGRSCIKRGEHQAAMLHYTQALTALGLEAETRDSRADCLARRAGCLLKLAQFPEALADADRCLALVRNHPKGLFRRGLALAGLGRVEARVALELALAAHPRPASHMVISTTRGSIAAALQQLPPAAMAC